MDGHDAVLAAWARLPSAVLRGHLSQRTAPAPSELSWKTLMSHVVPDYAPAQFRYRGYPIDQKRHDDVAAAILAHSARLDLVTRIVAIAIPIANKRFGDRRHRIVRQAFLRAEHLDDALDDETITAVADEIVDWLGGRALQSLTAYFDDVPTIERLAAELAAAWEDKAGERTTRPTAKALDAYQLSLGAYLRSAGFRPHTGGTAPDYADEPAAAAAWAAATELDAALGIVHVVPLQLSGYETPPMPSVVAEDAGALRLDQSLLTRLRSVVRGAQSGGFEEILPSMEEMATHEIAAASSPLGLHSPEARAGLAMSVLMLFDADAEASPADRSVYARPGARMSYVTAKFVRLAKLADGSRLIDFATLKKLNDAPVEVVHAVWRALHNLEHRPDIPLSHEEIWRRVAGEPETFVRNLKGKFQKETRRRDGTAVFETTGPVTRDLDDERASQSSPQRPIEDADAAVGFTLALLSEDQPQSLSTFLSALRDVQRSLGDLDSCETEWNALLELLLSAEIRLGGARHPSAPGRDGEAPASARPLEHDDLATYEELLSYLDRHLRS